MSTNHDLQNDASQWRKLTRRVWPYVVLIAICAVAFAFGLHRSPQLPNGGLTIEAKYLDFGQAWEGSRLVWKFPVTNTTNSPVEILNFSTSCTCATLNPRAVTLSAAETREFTIELHLDKWPPNELHQESRRFQGSIVPEIAGSPGLTARWYVQGEVKKLIKLSPVRPFFKSDLIAGQDSSPLMIMAECAVPIKDLKVECKPDLASINIHRGSSAYEIQVIPKTDVAPGPFRFELHISPESANGDPLPTKVVPIGGLVRPVIEMMPPSVNFGSIELGKSVWQVIVLSARNGQSFIVDSWECSNKQVVVEALSAAEGAPPSQQSFKVKQQITEVGSRLSTVTFVARMKGYQDINLKCPIAYQGLMQTSIRR